MVGTYKKSWPRLEVFAFKMMKGIHKCWIVGMFYGLFADRPWTKTGMEKIKLIRRKYALLLILADLNKAKDWVVWVFFSQYTTDQWQIFLTISVYKHVFLCAFVDTNSEGGVSQSSSVAVGTSAYLRPLIFPTEFYKGFKTSKLQ